MNRSAVLLARIRGLPIRIRRRAKRVFGYLSRLYTASLRSHNLIQVIMRVPGARIDPSYDPDRVKQYPPIGRCIYCRRTDNLSREHILAYSLGGDAILPKASCPACAKITKEIEEHCAEQIFRDVRVHHGVHSRRPERTELPMHELIDQAEGKFTAHLRPIGDHPGLLILPSFDPPGIVMGRPPSNEFVGMQIHGYSITADHDERIERIRRDGAKATWALRAIHIATFARMLAKWPTQWLWLSTA